MDDNSPSLGGDSLDHLTGNEPMLEVALLQLPLEELLRKMDDRQRRLFACDCAEHVLHIFEAVLPDNKRPHNAIAVARRYALGEPADAELDEWRKKTIKAAHSVGGNPAEFPARAAYYAACRTHSGLTPFYGAVTPASYYKKEISLLVADSAARFALRAVTQAAPKRTADSVEEAELNWQRQRAVWYLQNRDVGVSDGR